MSKKYDFQYIVIGSGPAGSTVATTLAKAKKSVALIEDRFFGGTNLNTFDVPYAVALDFAHTYAKFTTFPELRRQSFSFNLPSLISRELNTVIAAGGNDRKLLEESGVICFNGFANFLDPHTIAVKTKKLTARHFILATGAHLKATEISGLDTTNYLTPETAIKTRHLPEVVAIIGAGATGCEIATYYAELGSKVILFDMNERILPREDSEVSLALTDYFTKKLGTTVLYTCKVVAIGEDNASKYVIFRFGDSEKMVRVSDIVLATGSEPNVNFGLDNAGVKFKNTGITVNKYFETSAKHIYAIGDCIGGDSSTDIAAQQGLSLANNLVQKKSKTPINYQGSIRFINTPIPVATVGLNSYDLTKRDRKCKKSTINLTDITAGKIDGLTTGFVKLYADSSRFIIGATILAPHADLIAQEIAFAIRHHKTALELASTPHLQNSYTYAIKLAARKLVTQKLIAKH
ncbi:NAD(P)/FAD-dependent oxidoreductase [Candidatus Saccharibacteria bacterium]|nr:NAD(P)/FAD-dependent oxidoreductase [Candidatus Saccharibacteria bacterium]